MLLFPLPYTHDPSIITDKVHTQDPGIITGNVTLPFASYQRTQHHFWLGYPFLTDFISQSME